MASAKARPADPRLREARDILNTCVHCGYCLSTCSSYAVLGSELDSPRGRIHLIQDMLLQSRPASEKLTRHIDRCLSCLSCMTTCPSRVDYMHLVDYARVHIESTYQRPLTDRLLRDMIAFVLPRPIVFRLALAAGWWCRMFGPLLPKRLRTLLAMVPRELPAWSPMNRPRVFPAQGSRRRRVALMTGCGVQQVLRPAINEATVRLLTRHGCEVVVAEGTGCCGGLVYHMGKDEPALAAARTNVAAWTRLMENGDLDAVVINASGCGSTVKDYGRMLKHDTEWAENADRVARLTRDVTEVMAELGIKRPIVAPTSAGLLPTVAYHAACSLQHGQRITVEPKRLLEDAGFTVLEPAEGHLCCGSAGTYSLLQPEISARLRERTVANIEKTGAQAIATGNIGCLLLIAGATTLPVVHTVELLDWATGGPMPGELGVVVPGVAPRLARLS